MKAPYKSKILLASCFFAIIMATENLLMGIASAWAFTAVIDESLQGLIYSLLFALGVVAFMYAAKVLMRYFKARYIRQRIESSKNTLFNNTTKGFGENTEANIAMYSTNTEILENNQYGMHTDMVFYLSSFIISCVALLFFDWIYFVAAITLTTLPMLVPRFFTKRISKNIEDYSQKSKSYIDFVQDSTSGLYEIKSFFAQSFFGKMHAELNAVVEKARAKKFFTEGIMSRTIEMIGFLPSTIVFSTGALLVIIGRIDFAMWVMGSQLMNGIVGPINGFLQSKGLVKSSKPMAESYFTEPPAEGGIETPGFKNSIQMDNITFSYPQGDNGAVLQNYSVTFERGRSYAIVGESGCGKTTLAKIAAGILVPSGGRVLYDGVDTTGYNKASYCARVRYIDQDAHLFNFDIRQNIEMGQPQGKTDEFLQSLNLAQIAPDTESDLLSGGQKQRIVVARALNMLPDVLILDEPTASLDIETAISVIRYLKSYRDLTLIVVTHADNAEMLGLFHDVVRMYSQRH